MAKKPNRSAKRTTPRTKSQARLRTATRDSEARIFRTIGIFRADAAGNCLYVNEQWRKIAGMSAEAAAESGWVSAIHPDDRERVTDEWNRAVKSRQPFVSEYRVQTRKMEVTWVVSQARAELGKNGKVLSYVGTITDITERKRTEQAVLENQRQLQAVVNGTSDAVFIKDVQGRYLLFNRAAGLFVGKNPEAVIGHDDTFIFPYDDALALMERDRRVMADGKTLSREDSVTTADGQRRTFMSTKGPLFDSDGAVVGLFGIAHDITDLKRGQEMLRDSEERLRLAMETAHMGAWDWNVAANTVTYSPTLGPLFGLPPGAQHATVEEFTQAIHPEDRERIGHAITLSLETDATFCEEYRTVWPDGTVHWLDDRAQVHRDQAGKPVRMLGVVADITDRKVAESRLRTTQYAIDHATDSIFVIGSDGFFLDVNESACRRLGYTKEELLAKSVMDIDPDFSQVVWKDFWEAFTRTKLLRLETRHRSKSGEIYPVEVVANYIRHEGKELDYAYVRDISERKQTEEAARKAHALLRQVLDVNPHFIFAKDRDGRFTLVNHAVADCYGTTTEELVGKTDADFNSDPEQVEHFRRMDRRVLESQRESVIDEERITDARGKTRWLQTVKRPMLDERGQAIQVLGVSIDITARKEAEEALRESEMRYKLLTDATFDGIAIHDQGRIVEANSGLERIFGYGPGELVGKHILDLVADESREMVIANMRTGAQGPYEAMGRRKDGSIFHGEVVVKPYRYKGREVRLVAGRDITERKLAEDTVRASEEEHRALFEQSPLMCFLLDPDGTVLKVNRQGAESLGYDVEELLGRSVLTVFPEDSRDTAMRHVADCLAGPRDTLKSWELQKQRRDGSRLWVRESARAMTDRQGRLTILISCEDITERKRTEQALRDFALAQSFAMPGVSKLSGEGRYLFINDYYAEKLGYCRSELMGASWDTTVHPEDRGLAYRACADMRVMGKGECEIRGFKKDGTLFHMHMLLLRIDGEADSKEVGHYCFMRDITDRKRLEEQLVIYTAELEQEVAERAVKIASLELQRAQTEKLAALGQLAAGVAHEINNPIAGIKSAFQVVKQAIPDHAVDRRFVHMIDREIDRVSNIIKQLYQLYRAEPRKYQPVDLGVVFHDLTSLVANRLAQRRLSLTIDRGGSLPRLYLPPGDLLQVLLNLVTNAIDVSPEQTAIMLTVREESGDVRFDVSDRGPGISSDVLPRIFEPFFTTKTAGPTTGLGLGLSVSHSLVQAVGGRIDVATQINQGTTFTVVVPVSADSGEPGGSPLQLQGESLHDR